MRGLSSMNVTRLCIGKYLYACKMYELELNHSINIKYTLKTVHLQGPNSK